MFEYRLETIDVNEEQAQIVKVYVKNNEYVRKGNMLCSLETTKVIFDVEAKISGYVVFFVQEGAKIKFGEILYVIKKKAEDIVEIKKKKNLEENINSFMLTKKAEKYLQYENIKIEDIKSKFKGKKIIKVNDIKNILKSDIVKKGTNIRTINNRKRIVIIGAGAGGELVADILLSNTDYEIIGFVDDNPRKNFQFYNIKVIYK